MLSAVSVLQLETLASSVLPPVEIDVWGDYYAHHGAGGKETCFAGPPPRGPAQTICIDKHVSAAGTELAVLHRYENGASHNQDYIPQVDFSPFPSPPPVPPSLSLPLLLPVSLPLPRLLARLLACARTHTIPIQFRR